MEQLATMDWPPLFRALALREISPKKSLSIGCKISIVGGTSCYFFERDRYEIRDTQDSVLRVAALLIS